MTEREFATEVVSKLQQAGFTALFAGGCVRDELLGLTPADYDIATSAKPDEMQTLFRRTHSFGASFGVVEVLGPRDANGEWLKVQVATFRSDGTYTDGRRPDSVVFSSPEEDAARRDFTINGLFRDPISGTVYDYVGGEKDLRNKVLRAIGNPEERFTEDKLRILRAVRMAARFELAVDPATLAAAKAMAPQIRAVSAERIAEELRKILTHRHRARGIKLLREFGLMAEVIPEAEQDTSVEFDSVTKVSFPLAFAALLKGVRPESAEAICRRLRMSNDETERIVWLTANRKAFHDAEHQAKSKLYPLLTHPGAFDLIELTALDDHFVDADWCSQVRRLTPLETLNPPPLLTGDDLKAMGMKPGPSFKKLLDDIRRLQLDGEVSDRAGAEEKIRELVRKSQQG
ncbi:MAG: CCA tRNA nucleotidyltransferase [Fimbriiglobus sp.]|jgi:poly(A) polymerase|nr:CCA tRNA nucleotidyltransferase [Fimbriiglobus sp.]